MGESDSAFPHSMYYFTDIMDDTIQGSRYTDHIYDFHIGSPVVSDYDYERYTVTTNEDGLWKIDKAKENPYDITDKNGTKWSVTQHSDETLTVNKKDNSMNEKTNHLWKYNEDKILNEVEDYVTSTYGSHYCGSNEDYKDIQTIDLMAAKELAANFCQANILKYGSRYGQKNGRNKNDLMKVIHYAMLLLHFDGHYSRQNNGLSEFR